MTDFKILINRHHHPENVTILLVMEEVIEPM